MKTLYLTGLLLFGFAATGLAQQTRAIRIQGDAFMLGELGFILTETNGGISANAQMPGSQHTVKPDGPMLQAGDEIRFFNGERIRTVNALIAWYEGLDADTQIELGIRRGEASLVTRFPKSAEPISGNLGEVMQRQNGEGEGHRRVRTFSGPPGSAPDITPIADLGAVVETRGETLRVDMAYAPDHPAKLKEGDVLVSLNGEAVKSASALETALGELKVGDEITLEYKRSDKLETVTFPKPNPTDAPRVMIRTN